MSTSTALVTADELLELPRGQHRYELINGELKTMSPSGHVHGRISANLTAMLWTFVRDHRLGYVFGAETGFLLTSNPDTVLAPDVAFVTKQRVSDSSRASGYWRGAPDLAVEVLSPGDYQPKTKKKAEPWLRYGAQQVWLVNAKNETVTIHRTSGEARTFRSNDKLEADDLLPGFRVVVSEVFK